MAVNESGNFNHSLLDGITDGTVKKLAPNAGGDTDDFKWRQQTFQFVSNKQYGNNFGDYHFGDPTGPSCNVCGKTVTSLGHIHDSPIEQRVAERTTTL